MAEDEFSMQGYQNVQNQGVIAMANALKVTHTFKSWGGAFHAIFYKFIRNVIKPLFHNKKNNKKNARIYV